MRPGFASESRSVFRLFLVAPRNLRRISTSSSGPLQPSRETATSARTEVRVGKSLLG